MGFSEKDRSLLRKLHAMLGSTHPSEAENARQKLMELLDRLGLSWNDLASALNENANDEFAQEQQPNANAGTTANTSAVDFNPLDLVHHVLREHVSLSADQAIAVTLW